MTTALLDLPPSAEEIRLRLRKTCNTAPGWDGVEYPHLLALDPDDRLLETIYAAVWRLGIPDCWRRSRVALIHKKGDPGDIGNFRPIAMLPTIYKMLSGIVGGRLSPIAVDLGWLSSEQKGFLPSVRGIQRQPTFHCLVLPGQCVWFHPARSSWCALQLPSHPTFSPPPAHGLI